MAGTTTVSIAVSEQVADELPSDPVERERILELGLKEWRICRALEAYRGGHGSLAHAATQAGVPLREMIPLAFAHGHTPSVDPGWLTEPLSLDTTSIL